MLALDPQLCALHHAGMLLLDRQWDNEDSPVQAVLQGQGLSELGSGSTISSSARVISGRVWPATFRFFRILFSSERFRRPFRSLFPPQMFSLFIDLGHFPVDFLPTTSGVDLYEPLIKALRGVLANYNSFSMLKTAILELATGAKVHHPIGSLVCFKYFSMNSCQYYFIIYFI
jgi:hypothetical protein